MFLRILILFPLLLPSMVSGIKSSSRWWTLKRFRTLKKDVKYIKEQIGSMSEMDKTLFNKITEDSKKMTEINETLFQINHLLHTWKNIFSKRPRGHMRPVIIIKNSYCILSRGSIQDHRNHHEI